jgi:glycosyltransferase involved in cell wall biosynthesis
MARSLTELATVPPLREELRRRGTARAAAFSWRACAEAHVRAYEQAIASSSRS